MRKILSIGLVLMVSLLLLVGCGKSNAMTVYTLVSLPNDGGKMTNNTGFVIAEMNKALEPFNAKVEYVTADDYSVVSEAILSGTAHIGTPSGATYTKAHLEDANVVPMFIIAPYGKADQGGYPAFIGTHIDNKSDFEGMSEEEAIRTLKGKTFSFVSATSTSGRLVPTTTFWKVFGPQGTGDVKTRNEIFEITADRGGLFSEVQFGGSHPSSVELIVNKKVYAGAFCCQYADKYKDDIHIIAKTMVPNGPYWVNKEYMDQKHIDAIVKHFITLTPETAEANMFSEVDGESDEAFGIHDRFIAVEPSFYEFLEVMYEGE